MSSPRAEDGVPISADWFQTRQLRKGPLTDGRQTLLLGVVPVSLGPSGMELDSSLTVISIYAAAGFDAV